MTAYGYLRKSSVNVQIDSVSWETQEAAVTALAAANGDTNLTILSDWDKSGRLDRTRRPGYNRLLNAIEDGSATAIYGYSLSRLARSVKQLASLIDLCRERGVPIRLHVDHLDTSTASGVLLANVLGSVAQFEADIAGERARDSHAARRARGDRLGPRFYGDAAGEDPAEVLDALRLAGSFTGAARLLNEAGITTRGGKPWQPTSVRVVIRRVAPDLIPRNVARRGAVIGSFPLTRLLSCPTCGTVLTGKTSKGKYTRYVCSRGSTLPHPRSSISQEALMAAIRSEAARLITPERIETIARDEQAAAQIKERRQRIENAFSDGDLNREAFRVQKARLDAQEAALTARQSVIDLPAIDWDADAPSLNLVLRAMFDTITLDTQTFLPVAFHWAEGLGEWVV